MDPRPPKLRDQSGQAIVEAAFMLPAMIFLILCILQLTLLQQARVMVEYAAFNAARAGIVHNMNNGTTAGAYGTDSTSVMRNAAVYSLLPTFGRADSLAAIGATRLAYEAADAPMRARGLAMVNVAVLSPHAPDFATYGAHLNGKEIDFDDMRPVVAPSTLLSIQVRYLFELRVPFANKMLQAIWLAAASLKNWTGPLLTNPRLGTATGGDAVNGAPPAGGTLQDGMPGGLNLGSLSTLADGGKFFLPVDAWYSMRMQSNPYLQWAAP